MKIGSTTHPTPTKAEQLWLDLSDRFYEQLERRGERAAVAFAKRALYAAQGDDDMPTYVNEIDAIFKAANPEAIIAGLRVLRDAAEQEGDLDAANEYTKAIRSIAEASGTAPATASATAAPADADTSDQLAIDDTEPADALDMSKRVRKGKAGFLTAFKQAHGGDIRKRPGALPSYFAQSPPRANPAAPMAPPDDTLKLAKRGRESDEMRFKRAMVAQYRKGSKRDD